MVLKTKKQWLLAVALVAGIVTFTANGPVYADDHGCRSGAGCNSSDNGYCAFVSFGGGEDYCTCFGDDGPVNTCECSTGEYPPCNRMEG